MTRPGTFERVYAAIKDRLRQGLSRPGDRLEPAVLSDELNSSVTPVRDALHRLTGERLVEAPRHDGFRVPLVTESMLRHMYAWHLDLLLLALARRPRTPATSADFEPPAAEGPPYRAMNALFLRLAGQTGNPEHSVAMATLTDRLESVQRLEEVLLDAAESETGAILGAIRSGDRAELRRSLTRYHRRRQRIVPDLLEMLRG